MNERNVYRESYYRDGRASEAEYVDVPPYKPDLDYASFITGAVLVLAGWYARGLFAIAYDYHLLMLLTIVACYIVASRRYER